MTDDRNLLEFGFARSLGRTDLLPVLELRRLAEALDDSRLQGLSQEGPRSPGTREWLAEVYSDPRAGGDLSADALTRFEARRLMSDGRLLEGYARWQSQGGGPVTVRQTLLLAEAQAEARDSQALESIGKFPLGRSGEAGAVATRYYLRNGEWAKASEAARTALTSMHTSPWAETGIMERFLDILPAVATADRVGLPALGALMKKPFAGGVLYEERMAVWLTLSLMPGSDLDCREPLRYFEKGPPPSESYYQSRVFCAVQRDHKGLARARRDLERVRAALPEPLSPG